MSAEHWLEMLDIEGRVVREIPLAAGAFEIGRAGKDLACPEDAHLADRHAVIEVDQSGAVRVSDTGEGSGVWLRVDGIDGRRVEAGDQVWLGLQVVAVRRGASGWELHHHGPDGRRRGVYPVPPSGLFLGRASDVPLDVQDSRLSRRHAQVVVEGDHLRLYDRGAQNGTYVRLTHTERLRPGSELRLASQWFRFEERVAAEVPEAGVEASSAPEASPEATVVRLPGPAVEPEAAVDPPTPESPESPESPEPPEPPPEPPGGTGRSRGLAARLRGLAARSSAQRAAGSAETPVAESAETPVAEPAETPAAEASGEPVLVVIDAEPDSVSIEARPGMTVLEAVREAGLARGEPVDWECGDGGCGVCVLGVVEGADRLDPPDPATGEMKTIQITEQVVPDPNRYRLACLARVRGTVRLRKLT